MNSQLEMAVAFDRAGFKPADVHMTDLIAGRVRLERFKGLVACGGFSYGDVLGAGEGWAKSILFNAALREQFEAFFARADSFSLGVCNGCQMMSALKPLIPGAGHWPRFVRNRSEQFEGRVGLVEILPTPSVFFRDMAGSVLPIAVAHGEGRAEFVDAAAERSCAVQWPREPALGRQPRSRRDAVPGQPERLTGRHHRPDDRGWARHDPDAAPGAGVPHGAELLASGRLAGRRRLDADVPQRPRLGRLILASYTADRRDLVERLFGEEAPHHHGLLQLALADVSLVQHVLDQLEQDTGLARVDLRQR